MPRHGHLLSLLDKTTLYTETHAYAWFKRRRVISLQDRWGSR